MGLIAGFVLMSLFLFSIWNGDESNQAVRFYTIVVFSLIVGIAVGALLPGLIRLGLAVTGGALGFFVVVILYGLFLFKITSEPASLWFNNLIVFGIMIGAIFGFEYHR